MMKDSADTGTNGHKMAMTNTAQKSEEFPAFHKNSEAMKSHQVLD